MTTTTQDTNLGSDVLGNEVARVAWATGAALLCWLAALHLGVVIGFAAGLRVSAALAPAVTAAAIAAAWWFARREGLARPQVLASVGITAAVIAAGVALAGAFFDMTWDGQWYHQTAVYKMAEGWNPLRDPVHDFGRHTWNMWVLHYAKGPWYIAVALFATTRNIEMAKAASAIVPVVAFLITLAAAIDLGLSRRWAALVALLVAMNPVTTCGLVTHQVDGMLVSLMACSVAAGICFLARPGWMSAVVVFASAVLCMNMKFTGLVYLCFFFLAGGVYCLWRRRDLILPCAGLVGATLLAGTLVFGFNPYVTNTIHRGNPFYPMQGSKAYPSLAQQGQDPIERWETPRNMMGRSRFLRLAYGVFGRPGTAPYVTRDAQFMIPFAATARDFALYYFHDVRIGGFGPLFSGVLLLAVALAAAAWARGFVRPGVVLLLAGAIVGSLLVSQHTWWARYGPHLWWLPIVALAAVSRTTARTWWARAAATLAIVLLANAIAIAAVHARWEWRSTTALRQQLADLRTAGPITVDLAYFDVPVAERFRTFGVAFDTAARYQCDAGRQVTLQSVCRGYPEWIRVCVADPSRAAALQALPHWQWSAHPPQQ